MASQNSLGNQNVSDDHIKFYQCSICKGLLTKPLKCMTPTCEMIYCAGCVVAARKRPNLMESAISNEPAVINIKDIKFRCSNQNCQQPIQKQREDEKEEDLKQECKREDCKNNVASLTAQKQQLEIQIQASQQAFTLERQILGQRLNEIQQESLQHQLKVNQNSQQLQILQTENNQLKQTIATTAAAANNTSSQLMSCKCPSGHPMKQMNSFEQWKDANCDGCGRFNICKKSNLYFSCGQGCNYDLCTSCYLLHITGQSDKIPGIKAQVLSQPPRHHGHHGGHHGGRGGHHGHHGGRGHHRGGPPHF